MDFIPPPPPERIGFARRAARNLGWWSLYAALVGAILGMISPTLARHLWICEILCHFQPQYVVIFAILTAIFSIARRWKMAAISATFMSIAFATWILPLYLTDHRSSTGPRNLRLLSANLDCHNPSPEKFLSLVTNARPQIVLVFELTRDWAPMLQKKMEGFKYSHVSPSPGHSGCGIFSTIPLDEVSVESVPPYPNFVVVAKVTIDGRQVRIFGTHPLAPYTPTEMQARNEQFANLSKLVGDNSTSTIVAGDFNSSSWSPAYSDFTNATHLRDTRQGFGILPTFPSYFFPVRTTIDHCLVSDDIEVLDRWVGPNIDSDHLPILVDLRMPDFSQ